MHQNNLAELELQASTTNPKEIIKQAVRSIFVSPQISTDVIGTESQSIINSNIDNPKPLDPASFPDQPRNGLSQLPATIANTLHLCKGYNIKV